MVSKRAGRDQHAISLESAMAGILALLVADREERSKGDKDATKTEVLLSNAGLSVDDIAAATGKKPAAVRKAIQRARGK
jgi:hypothetical protein